LKQNPGSFRRGSFLSFRSSADCGVRTDRVLTTGAVSEAPLQNAKALRDKTHAVAPDNIEPGRAIDSSGSGSG